MTTCMHCRTGTMQKPENGHPSYLVCSNCNVIELTYKPQDYQEPLHQIPYQYVKNENGDDVIAVQLVGAFGG